MGVIFGKFRKKKTTLEALETLDKEIKSIEEFRRSTEQFHKKIVGRFVLFSVVLYLLSAFIFYFYFFPASLYERLYYIIPLILAPVIIISVKRVLTWYYNRKISRKQNKLIALREEKRKMLDKVMDTETYKVAKTILEKFAPEQIRKNNVPAPETSMTPYKPRMTYSGTTPQGLRQRPIPTPMSTKPMEMVASQNKPAPLVTFHPSVNVQTSAAIPVSLPSSGVSGNPLPLPRAILPRERSVLDKMVEYLVGDGPSNRYALICQHCSSHNGMALREEFEYLSFRCCYCFGFNPALKKRPTAPKLEYTPSSTIAPVKLKYSDTSDSEKNSRSDTDSESASENVPKVVKEDTNYKISDTEKLSDFDKLSDCELKMSDVEHPPLETITDVNNEAEQKKSNEELINEIEEIIDQSIEDADQKIKDSSEQDLSEHTNTEPVQEINLKD